MTHNFWLEGNRYSWEPNKATLLAGYEEAYYHGGSGYEGCGSGSYHTYGTRLLFRTESLVYLRVYCGCGIERFLDGSYLKSHVNLRWLFDILPMQYEVTSMGYRIEDIKDVKEFLTYAKATYTHQYVRNIRGFLSREGEKEFRYRISRSPKRI